MRSMLLVVVCWAPLVLWQACARAVALMEDVVGAFHDIHLHRDQEQANALDVWTSQYCDAVKMRNPGPGLWRTASLSDAWWVAFLTRRARRFGKQLVDVDAVVITRRGQAEALRRFNRMLKAELPEVATKGVANG